MIYNDTLKNSYGTFTEISSVATLPRYKPMPTETEYKTGYILRYFAKKVNENITVEIKSTTASQLRNPLYKVVNLNWKISGPKNDVSVGGITQKSGVMDQNKLEIERVLKDTGVDLSVTLTNLLEYWRGS